MKLKLSQWVRTAYTGPPGHQLALPDRRAEKLGIEVVRKSIVGDHRDTLRASVHEALERVELVIASAVWGRPKTT